MNCCDYNCTQGRDCPARKPKVCPHCQGIGYDASGLPCTCVTAKVAKVGQRMHGHEPLRASTWRAYLKDLARSVFLALAVVLVSAIVVSVLTGCTTTAKTRTGTLPDGSEYCVIEG